MNPFMTQWLTVTLDDWADDDFEDSGMYSAIAAEVIVSLRALLILCSFANGRLAPTCKLVFCSND